MWLWALLAIAVGYGVARVAWGYPRPARRLTRLWPGEAHLLATAADAMFPAGGAIPVSGREADVPGYMDRLLDASDPRQRALMHCLFFLVEHGTLFFPGPGPGRFRRFSAQGFDQRVALLDGWAESGWFPRRLVFTSLRALLTLGYFSHPPLLRALGVAPYAIETPVCEADLLYPRIGAHPSTIPYTREDLSESDGVPIDLEAPLHPDYAGDAA